MSETIYEGDYSRALREYGLEHLTGESCAISLRILYDMNGRGIRLVESAFSIKIDRDSTPKNWNSKVNDLPAIASIRLSHSQAKDLLIYALASTYKFVTCVVARPVDNRHFVRSYIYATDDIDDQKEILNIIDKSNWCDVARVCQTYDSQPRQGLENVHAFSGRAR